MTYYKEIENYFLQIRGKIFGESSYNLLSPKEISLIKEWKETGTPLKVVKNGIEESLKRFFVNNPNKRNEPPSLLYCKPTVKKHYRRYKETNVGSKSDSVKESLLPEKNMNHTEKLQSLKKMEIILNISDNDKIKVFDQIDNLIGSLSQIPDDLSDDPEIEENILILIELLLPHIPLTKIKSRLSSFKTEIAKYKAKMTKEKYRETRIMIIHEFCLEYFNITNLKGLL